MMPSTKPCSAVLWLISLSRMKGADLTRGAIERLAFSRALAGKEATEVAGGVGASRDIAGICTPMWCDRAEWLPILIPNFSSDITAARLADEKWQSDGQGASRSWV